MDTREEFLAKIDSDKSYASKRRKLEFLSVLLLVVSLSGATVKGANTFIIEVEFANQLNLNFLLMLSVVFMIVRYYSSAYVYHSKLYDMWTNEMIGDSELLYYDGDSGHFSGLLTEVANFHDSPSQPGYICSTLLRRYLLVEERLPDQGGDVYHVMTRVPLHKFRGSWTWKCFLRLLSLESKYQFESVFKRRECLDLLSPYLLALAALVSYCYFVVNL